MFKGSLIDNQEYYKLRRKLLLIGLPSSIAIGFLINLWGFSILVSISIVLITSFLIFIQSSLIKSITALTKNRKIEIDDEFIRIKSKSGEIKEEINIDVVNKIIVKESYSVPEENMKGVFKEMRGDQLKNFIIVNFGEQTQKYDFTLDTYYMIEQLKKVINQWRTKGIFIETVE